MNKLVKKTLIAIGLNLLLLFLFALPLINNRDGDALGPFLVMLMFFGLSLFVQLIVAIVFISGEKRKETGKAMLLALGILLLIGLSVCGGAWL